MMESASYGTLAIQRNGAIVECDETLAQQLKTTSEKLVLMPWVLLFPLETLHVLTDVFSLFDSPATTSVSLSNVKVKDGRAAEISYTIIVEQMRDSVFSLSFSGFDAKREKRMPDSSILWHQGDYLHIPLVGEEMLSVLVSISSFTDYEAHLSQDACDVYVRPMMDAAATSVGLRFEVSGAHKAPGRPRPEDDHSVSLDILPFGAIVADSSMRILYANRRAFDSACTCSLVGTKIDVVAGRVDESEGTVTLSIGKALIRGVTPSHVPGGNTTFIFPLAQCGTCEFITRGQGNLIHDIKTPLVTLGAYVSYLEEDLQERSHELMKRDVRAMRVALGQVSRRLSIMEGRESGQHLVSDVSLIAKSVVSSQDLPGQGPDIVCEESLEGVDVHIDGASLGFVLDVLVSNAVAACDGVEGARVELGCRTSDDGALLFVKDSGCGMDPCLKDTLFSDPGMQQHRDMSCPGGGVSMARSLLESAHAKMWAESEVGQGTTVWLYIPRAPCREMAKFKDFGSYVSLGV